MEKRNNTKGRKNKDEDIVIEDESLHSKNTNKSEEEENNDRLSTKKTKGIRKSKSKNKSKNDTELNKEIPEQTEESNTKTNDCVPTIKKQKTLFDCGINSNKIKSSEEVDSSIPKLPNDKKDLRIYSWNVAGLRAVIKKPEWKKFLDSEKPDILMLNETKIDDGVIEKMNLNSLLGSEYKAYFNNSVVKKGYSGTAIYTKYKPLSVKYGLDQNKHNGEGRIITIEFEKFYLIGTYTPNAGENLKRLDYRVNEWDVDFRNYLNELKKKKHVIWGGDANCAYKEIDIHNPKSNLKSAGYSIEERESFAKYFEKGWVDTFRKRNPEKVCYTYWSMRGNAKELNKGWRLDYFLVDEEFDSKNVVDSEILVNYNGSDHCPIKLTVDNSL